MINDAYIIRKIPTGGGGGGGGTTDYSQLENLPRLNGIVIKNSRTAEDYGLSLLSETGNKINLSIDDKYRITATLYNKSNQLISTSDVIDLPLESVVVSGRYEAESKKIILTLQDGSEIEIPVADIINGLATKTELDAVEAKIPSIDGLATKQELIEVENKIPSIAGLAKESWVETYVANSIPKNVSSFINDVGYVTSTILESYATKTYVDEHHDDTKQEKITVDNKLDYSLLSNTPEIPEVPTKVSAFENDAGYLTEHQDISDLATKEELKEKQDVLTAGENITIVDNVISAVGGAPVLQQQIVTDITVGHLEAGSTLPVGMSIEEILRKILIGSTPTTTFVYYGSTTEVPSSKDGFIQIPGITKESLLSDGLIQNLKSGDKYRYDEELPPDYGNQYSTIAVTNDVVLTKWMSQGSTLENPFTRINKGEYSLYYLNTAEYNQPEGTNYVFEFIEG